MEWIDITKEQPKPGDFVLIWFESGHAESADIFSDDEGGWYYALFDGEMLNTNPIAWMPLKKPEMQHG